MGDGRDGIIPVPVEVVGLDIEGFEGCFRDLDALRIAPPVDVTGDREAGFCFG